MKGVLYRAVQIGKMTSRTGMGITLCKDKGSLTNGHLMWQSTWKSCVSSDNSAPKPALGLSMVFTEHLEVVMKLSAMSSFLLIHSRQTGKLPLWCLPLITITLQVHPLSRLSP